MPDNDLQSLKQHSRVLELYRTRISLKQDGKRWRGPCPYHVDKHATNFDIWSHEGTYIFKCLSCGQSGSILDLIQKTDSTDFKGAVHIVREFCSDFANARNKVESVFKPVSDSKPVIKTYPEESYKAYEEAFKNSKEAQEFLRSRGIDTSVARRLRIGYRQDVGKLAGDAGKEVSGSGWISFATFGGVRDTDRSVTSIKYRSIVGKFFTKQPGMGTSLWNTQTIDYLEPVFLVEGELDACVLEMTGFKSVSLPNATYQLSPADKDTLLSAEYVVLAGDNDDAGKKGDG